jgi:predicted nucleic acid-binding Zn ribbon protein
VLIYAQHLHKAQTSFILRSHPQNGDYVLPFNRNPWIEYNPFDAMNNILFSLMLIGFKHSKQQSIANEVLEFCNTYGYFGIGKAVIEKTYDDGSVKLYHDNVLGKRAFESGALEKYFQPFEKEYNIQAPIISRMNARVLKQPSAYELEKTEIDYSYNEAVDWYGRFGEKLLIFLQKHFNGEAFDYKPGNVSFVYHTENKQTYCVWAYDSLMSACELGFIEMLTTPVPDIRLCKCCGKPFLTGNTRAEYCSASCRNVTNVKASRQRKRNEKQI